MKVAIRGLAEWVVAIVEVLGRLTFDTSKPDGTPRKLLDVGRLSAVGWKPGISLEEGVRGTYDWFVAHQAEIRA